MTQMEEGQTGSCFQDPSWRRRQSRKQRKQGFIPPVPSSQCHYSALGCICIEAAHPPTAAASLCTLLSASSPVDPVRYKSLCCRDNGLGCINSSAGCRLAPSKQQLPALGRDRSSCSFPLNSQNLHSLANRAQESTSCSLHRQ